MELLSQKVTRCRINKLAQIFEKLPKMNAAVFPLISEVFKIAQKVTKYLGYFCENILHQELLKIAH